MSNKSNFVVLLLAEPAKLMAKYYLKFDTMKHIMQAPANCSIEDALHIICHAEEIACIYSYFIFYARVINM